MKHNVHKIREDFPLLRKKRNGKPIAYFDNACMTLRPQSVIDAIKKYYEDNSSCAGRSSHRLSEELEREIAAVRAKIAKFIGAKNEQEIVFTGNTTASINLVANAIHFEKGDGVLITGKEHNSNVLPWQLQAERRGIELKVFKLKNDHEFDRGALEETLRKGNIKLVSVFHISNLDGSENPIKEISAACKKHGALLLVDGAQAVPHKKVDVKELGADFYAFSGHKMLGPSGIGVLWAKYDHLLKMRPFIVGGGTVQSASYHEAQYLMPPMRFEAGLQNYAGILGMGAAIDYISALGFSFIESHERALNEYLAEEIGRMDGCHIIGPQEAKKRNGILTFYSEKMQFHDVAIFLDEMENIMVRAGQFCDHSWFHEQSIKGAVRISSYFYNTLEEAELLVNALEKLAKMSR